MPEIEINDLSMVGVVSDVPPYQLPPEAFSLGNNMRFTDDDVERLLGWAQVFGAPPIAPEFLMPISTADSNYWLFSGLTKIYSYDGSDYTDVTRTVGGDYNAADGADWNGTILGGIPIFNNGIDVPQFKANMSSGTHFENLTNWPATQRAKLLRSFGPFLIALNLTDTGVSYPHLVQWSSEADPGSIPGSWDYTDATVDAGRKDLEDVNSGVLLDALPLQGTMYLYKEQSTWKMSFIGGRFIFDFKALFETSGILAPRCVALTGDGTKHVVATQDDIIWHNGNRVQSILNKRQRSTLFNELDTLSYVNSFLFSNPLRSEMWFCYPTQGNVYPNKAIIWNYRHGGEAGVITNADGITFRHAAVGNIDAGSEETWEDGDDEWDEDTGPWSTFDRHKVLLAGTEQQKLLQLDSGTTRDGVAFTGTLQREGLSLIGRKRNGDWIVDHKRDKMWQRLWPKIQGGPVSIRVGVAQTVRGATTWGPAITFDPATDRFADPDSAAGMALAVEFSAAAAWRMSGYKVEIALLGEH